MGGGGSTRPKSNPKKKIKGGKLKPGSTTPVTHNGDPWKKNTPQPQNSSMFGGKGTKWGGDSKPQTGKKCTPPRGAIRGKWGIGG